jgi:hypothetical protein
MEAIFIFPICLDQRMKAIFSPGTVACAAILLMGGWTLWVDGLYGICTKANALWKIKIKVQWKKENENRCHFLVRVGVAWWSMSHFHRVPFAG